MSIFLVYLVAAFGALVATTGLAGVLAPGPLISLIREQPAGRRYYLAILVRVLLGVVLIQAAPETRAPLLIQILGIVSLLGAFAIALMGPVRLDQFVDWWVRRPSAVIRLWSGLAFAFGVGLIYVAL